MTRAGRRCRTILVGGLPVRVYGGMPTEKDIEALKEVVNAALPLAHALGKCKTKGHHIERLRDGRLKPEGQGPMTTQEFIEWVRTL